MRKITRGLATAAVAAALVAGPSAAAFAYQPTAPAAGFSVNAEGVVTLTFTGFAPNALVTITIEGTNASQIQTVASRVFTTTTTSDAEGTATITVRLPASASGNYEILAVDEFGNDVTSSISAAALVAAQDDDAEGLANTGADSAAAFWFAGGLLALGATTVITLNVVRRNRAQA